MIHKTLIILMLTTSCSSNLTDQTNTNKEKQDAYEAVICGDNKRAAFCGWE